MDDDRDSSTDLHVYGQRGGAFRAPGNHERGGEPLTCGERACGTKVGEGERADLGRDIDRALSPQLHREDVPEAPHVIGDRSPEEVLGGQHLSLEDLDMPREIDPAERVDVAGGIDDHWPAAGEPVLVLKVDDA